MKTFAERIEVMNKMYKLPVNTVPALPSDTVGRLGKFKATLLDEIDEVNIVINDLEYGKPVEAEVLVALADWFGDMTVYIRSEAMKYGIPLEQVLEKIMASNESKLGADGQPIYDANGKFLKGPKYQPPEDEIRKLLASYAGV